MQPFNAALILLFRDPYMAAHYNTDIPAISFHDPLIQQSGSFHTVDTTLLFSLQLDLHTIIYSTLIDSLQHLIQRSQPLQLLQLVYYSISPSLLASFRWTANKPFVLQHHHSPYMLRTPQALPEALIEYASGRFSLLEPNSTITIQPTTDPREVLISP